MKKTKSIFTIIMIMIVTLIGFSACNNNKCNKDEKCEKSSCCKDEKCCDKCSDSCTAENKCCDKCAKGNDKACCKKEGKDAACDTASMSKVEKEACCKKDSTVKK